MQTMENQAEDIWADDKLGRQGDADYLASFLRNRSAELVARGVEKSFVLNLDATWGAGKSFFLERLQRQLKAEGHVAVYINAWRDDFADDPLIAVMAAIDEEIAPYVKKPGKLQSTWKSVKKNGGKIGIQVARGLALRAAGTILTHQIAKDIEGVLGDVGFDLPEETLRKSSEKFGEAAIKDIEKVLDKRAEEAVSDFSAMRTSLSTFRAKLKEFVIAVEQKEHKVPPMFVLVDELDRCRPPYAIATLERIKHLFDTPRVVFIAATDSSQLVHSIGAVYGQGFESGRYLKRFFDHVYSFEKPSTRQFIAYLMKSQPLDAQRLRSPFQDDHQEFIVSFFDAVGTDLRSIEQIYGLLSTIVTSWDSPVPLQLLVLLPLLLAYHEDRTKLAEGVDVKSTALSRDIKKWGFESFTRINMRETVRNFEPFMIAAGQAWGFRRNLLDTINAERGAGRLQGWVHDQFVREFNTVYGGKPRPPDNKYRCTIEGYPRLIRQAGRIDMAAEIELDD
ncbi:MAG: hypothetical protein BGN87_06285 [Rhizobiales bacterium 65-79]|nr:MAG: hypothetical protein BGN87_06285 [Rhizobiales bacterium 65-79]